MQLLARIHRILRRWVDSDFAYPVRTVSDILDRAAWETEIADVYADLGGEG